MAELLHCGRARMYKPTIQELKRVQYLNKEIKTLSEILDEFKSSALVGAKSYRDKESTAKYSRNSKGEKRTVEIESLETEIANRMVELHILYRQILHWIFSIDDSLVRLIFEEKYLNCRTWNQVADRVGGANTEDSVKKMAYRYLEKELIK